MSGILAAKKSSGCCCRPQPCTCFDFNRPGAIVDRSFSTITASADINYNLAERDNASVLGMCGASCPCTYYNPGWSGAGAGLYAYRKNGNRTFSTIEECKGCITGSCPSCSTVTGRANINLMTLTTFVSSQVLGGYYYETQSNSLLDQVVGNYNWQARRVGYCLESEGAGALRIRSYCFPIPPGFGGGGLGGLVTLDPNGAYINSNTGEYQQGRWGQTIGAVYIIAGARIEPPFLGVCSYRMRITLYAISFASMMDNLAFYGSFPFNMADNVNLQIDLLKSYEYVKPCRTPTDTVFGTYELVGPSDYDEYDAHPICGQSQWFRRVSMSAERFLEVT